MSNAALETAIEAAWEARDSISVTTKGEARDAIEATLTALDSGSLRVAEKRGADWCPRSPRSHPRASRRT